MHNKCPRALPIIATPDLARPALVVNHSHAIIFILVSLATRRSVLDRLALPDAVVVHKLVRVLVVNKLDVCFQVLGRTFSSLCRIACRWRY